MWGSGLRCCSSKVMQFMQPTAEETTSLRQEHNIAGAEIRDDLRSVLTQKDPTQSWRKEAGLRNKRWEQFCMCYVCFIAS